MSGDATSTAEPDVFDAFRQFAALEPDVLVLSLAMPVFAPDDQWVLVALFAYSDLRFAGFPAHKALIVGPAERNQGGRVTDSYYLVRNLVVIRARSWVGCSTTTTPYGPSSSPPSSDWSASGTSWRSANGSTPNKPNRTISNRFTFARK